MCCLFVFSFHNLKCVFVFLFFFFFKQKTAYEIMPSLVGSEMCIRDSAYCALANGGTLYEPHVVSTIKDAHGNVVQQIQPKVIRKLPASQQTLLTMRLATRAVVTSQHTYNLVDLPVKVAGKTGTSEFGTPNKYGVLPYHEWFVAYTQGDPYLSLIHI